MVSVATSLGRNGLQDWLLQRISAVILTLYTILLIVIWCYVPEGNMHAWKQIFSMGWMRYFTLFALLALIVHAWIGLWTVTTDYLKETWARLTTQIIIYATLLLYLIWGIQILWG